MSPRAAWRLESLGFGEVYDYVPGKIDWLAHGLPMEGTDAGNPTAGSLAQRHVATCALDDTVGAIRDRAQGKGGVCVVTNAERIVFGILREKELASPDDTPVSTAMRPGPSTFRPNVKIAEMAEYLTKHDLSSAPITTADGRLVGILFRDVAIHAAHNGE
jgi:Mg/Co/Ni transporter MgtE